MAFLELLQARNYSAWGKALACVSCIFLLIAGFTSLLSDVPTALMCILSGLVVLFAECGSWCPGNVGSAVARFDKLVWKGSLFFTLAVLDIVVYAISSGGAFALITYILLLLAASFDLIAAFAGKDDVAGAYADIDGSSSAYTAPSYPQSNVGNPFANA